MEYTPLTCPTCGNTTLWNSFSDGCPLCTNEKKEENYEEGE